MPSAPTSSVASVAQGPGEGPPSGSVVIPMAGTTTLARRRPVQTDRARRSQQRALHRADEVDRLERADLGGPVQVPLALDFDHIHFQVKLPQPSVWSRLFRRGGKKAGSSASASATMARPPRERVILDNVEGHIAAGEMVAIVGQSGSGKSAASPLASTRRPSPCASTCRNAHTSAGCSAGWSSRYRVGQKRPQPCRHFGFVLQDDVLFAHLTVRETLSYAVHGGCACSAISIVELRLTIRVCAYMPRVFRRSFACRASGRSRKRNPK